MQKQNLSLVTQMQAALSMYDTPDPARCWGLSTSQWSHVVDWQIAWDAGARFALIKMMDGKSKVPYAEENYRGAKDKGFLVCGYSWLYPSYCISAGAQAREFLAYIKDHPCDIRPSVDFEWTKWGGKDANPNFDDLYGWASPFADGYGKLPMCYTAPGYWNDPARITKTLNSKSTYFVDMPLWGAEYRAKAFATFGAWPNYKFWQFSAVGNGALYGYPKDGEKEAELNYWTGTYADLCVWCAVNPPKPPDPPQPPTPDILTRITANEAAIAQLQVAALQLGLHVEKIERTIADMTGGK